ncbi:hypothetical protein QYF36_017135 [Acer negundo]|nr:hypothetical protein QYF36_017135 [Acer negundo]
MTSQPPPAPPPVTKPKAKRQISSSIIIAIVAPITVTAVFSIAGYCFLTKRARKKYNTIPEEIDVEALQLDFGTIQAATNGFSTDNKLGEGGFGQVYKGVLSNGQEIAVKRLSKSSGQGVEEFKNEIVLVAKLQHRNLVRLLGFCLEGQEKILVYEFVPNKSLDYFLFDPEKQGQLDWTRRYKIIGGIARGILYLHEDSRLRIIHRDLKASNVLLDGNMNPKVSDFGMARIFGVDQTQAKTKRIVGTYGYMSPEYAMRGQFSVKSDVYSFGVLVLEILTGKKISNFSQTDGVAAGNDITTIESLQYDFGTIQAATNGFSTDNKLGEGGFGEVYKGVLSSGQEIAVKRLSSSSGQGTEEFKNEVVLVAKLQHRNLVRLLGFCLEGQEKILVYEFVPNKSLDYFLFDLEKQGQLDWTRRYKIIGGIARGILYLHEDSRLRIIHRDLKASNVLLDGDMNPKISDFGMARIVGVDQSQANTNRIVGTYGYMSPEYAMHGQFSVKSDVFSFGVLVLEIITGKKNSNFYQTDGAADLLSYVWKHWRDGTPAEVLDTNLTDSYSRNEVMRCIHLLSSFLPSLLNQENKKFQTAICVCSDETSITRKYVFALYFNDLDNTPQMILPEWFSW